MLGLSVSSENSWCIDCASYFCLLGICIEKELIIYAGNKS